MKFYIIYDDSIDYELRVVDRTTSVDVSAFIEDRIDNHGYRLDDFKVVQGVELSLRAIIAPIKVLVGN